ncbi:MAG: superoxide dismutase family protein [Acidobacteria bacterium]|nr:superoxide dismutase family protein [Acidobacteriota bacterium]
MKATLILLVTLSVALTAAYAKEKPAKAELKDSSGAKVGTATFSAAGAGVLVTVKLTGAKPGKHGLHIHSVGKCEAPDFKSAAGHFNPSAKHHGAHNPEGKHGGDLPNITADASGKGSIRETVSGVSLGTGDNGLFHQGGTAIVLHADADDLKSDPAGNSGARVACGVIGR